MGKKEEKIVDMVANTIILQNYLDKINKKDKNDFIIYSMSI